MRNLFSLTFATLLFWGCAAGSRASAQQSISNADVEGAWQAEEDYFRAVILIERGDGGDLAAYLTDASRSRDTPFSETAVRGDSVFLALDRMSIEFRGRLGAGRRIEGVYTQGDQAVPLTLVPADPGRDNRPQTPRPPFPYALEEVAFEAASGVLLVGTLTVPDGDGPHSAVVLLQGSGLADRDAEIGGHRMFAVLADRLTRSGVAVLRYDKRSEASLDGLTRDAEAAVRYLRARPEVDAARVGVVGHSEGALVAPRAASTAGGAFIVLLSPPATPLGDALVEQNARLAAASGAPEPYVTSVRSLMARVVTAARSGADSAAVTSEIRSAFAEAGVSGDALDARVGAHTSLAFRTLVSYDPGPALGSVRVPTLAVVGSLDLFTPPEETEAPLRAALGERGTVRVIAGMNHWLQPAATGLPDEIEQIETTVSPEVLDLVTVWIKAHTSAGE